MKQKLLLLRALYAITFIVIFCISDSFNQENINVTHMPLIAIVSASLHDLENKRLGWFIGKDQVRGGPHVSIFGSVCALVMN